MFVALLVIALSLLLIKNGDNTGQDPLNKPKIWEAWYILAMTCVFDNAYAWSWGPLGTVPRCHAASAPRPLNACVVTVAAVRVPHVHGTERPRLPQCHGCIPAWRLCTVHLCRVFCGATWSAGLLASCLKLLLCMQAGYIPRR